MENTESLAVAYVQTPGGEVRYDGDARIDGVPGFAAPIPSTFSILPVRPAGVCCPRNALDVVDGAAITCIDNGMPVVCLLASDVGLTGYEDPALSKPILRRADSLSHWPQGGTDDEPGDVSSMTVPR